MTKSYFDEPEPRFRPKPKQHPRRDNNFEELQLLGHEGHESEQMIIDNQREHAG